MNSKIVNRKVCRISPHGPLSAALLVIVAGLSSGCGDSSAKSQQPQGSPGVPVKLQVAKSTTFNDTTDYVATLKSRDSAVIMPQVEGQITQIFVHSGERVEAGSPMIEIDPLKQQATVKSQQSARAAQEANLIWAKKQYERTQGLAAAGVVSKQDLDQSKQNLDAAQAQMEALDSQVREQEV